MALNSVLAQCTNKNCKYKERQEVEGKYMIGDITGTKCPICDEPDMEILGKWRKDI